MNIQERIKLGPIDNALPGAMEITLGMYGDKIQEVDTQFGFAKRSILESCIGQRYARAQLKFGRIDPENGMILDRVFSEGVETILRTEVSARTQWIREITTSVSELNSFLRYLSKMSYRFGIEVLTHIILKHRESLLDLIELLTGSRYGYYYVMPGGVRYELTEGFQERLEKWIKAYSADFNRIQELFLWTHSFHNRLRSLGRVIDNGDLGFISESSIETTRYGIVSHVESRLQYALESTLSLCEELSQMLNEKVVGETNVAVPNGGPGGSSNVVLETARGPWALALTLDGSNVVTAIAPKLPSDFVIEAIPLALAGEYFEDLPVILESLYFSIPELDR